MRLVATLLLLGLAFGAVQHVEATQDNSIVKVITLLKEMLEKSKDDGNEDRELYAKYKCYCDENNDEKTESIETLTKQIKLLSSEIAELQADTAKRSGENGELKPMKEDNERARSTAESIRGKENTNFADEESDLKAAIVQMNNAIEELSKVGADQTAGGAADTEKFMAGHSLIRVQDNVKAAVQSAAIFAGPKQKRALAAFLQAPFTGTYTAQSGEIVGILKNLRDSFKENLSKGRKTETAASETDSAFMKTKTDNYDEMQSTYEDNESVMGSNDGDLSSKKSAKESAEQTLADDTLFLSKLKKMCKETQYQYETRKMIRANEEAAVSQAIAVLNSDSAVESFGKAGSTKDGTALLQFGAISRKTRTEVKHQLQHAAKKLKSLRLARIATSLEDGNPFDKVTDEVDEMIEVIDREDKSDDEQQAWCDSEREVAHSSKSDKKDKVDTLISGIDSLDDTVNNADTGLKTLLDTAGKDLKTNRKDQQEEIDDRSDTNKLYQKEIENLNAAYSMLETAKKTLSKFYDWMDKKMGPHHYEKKEGKDSGGGNIKKLEEATIAELEAACSDDAACVGFNTAGYLKKALKDEGDWYTTDESLYVKEYDGGALLQTKKDPAPPNAFAEGRDSGQQEKGNTVLNMISDIMTEVEGEIANVHKGEEASQHEFEDDMDTLKTQEADLITTIQTHEQEITDKEADIEAKHEDREKTELEHKNLERYIEKIKPGCDFITENIAERKENRGAETTALNGALDAMTGTPAYKEAAASAEVQALGTCAEKCEDREALACKACIDGVSEAGYCASHSDAAGC